MRLITGGSFVREFISQPVPFCRSEPVGCLRSVDEIKQHNDAKQNRGKSLDQKQPLPSREPEHSIKFQQRAGQRAANDATDRDGCHESCERAALPGTTGSNNKLRPGRNRPRPLPVEISGCRRSAWFERTSWPLRLRPNSP